MAILNTRYYVLTLFFSDISRVHRYMYMLTDVSVNLSISHLQFVQNSGLS